VRRGSRLLACVGCLLLLTFTRADGQARDGSEVGTPIGSPRDSSRESHSLRVIRANPDDLQAPRVLALFVEVSSIPGGVAVRLPNEPCVPIVIRGVPGGFREEARRAMLDRLSSGAGAAFETRFRFAGFSGPQLRIRCSLDSGEGFILTCDRAGDKVRTTVCHVGGRSSNGSPESVLTRSDDALAFRVALDSGDGVVVARPCVLEPSQIASSQNEFRSGPRLHHFLPLRTVPLRNGAGPCDSTADSPTSR
jgi:hypothetical protein